MKLDSLQRYFQTVGPSVDPTARWDANESLAFARQLEFIYTQTYDVKYADLKARTIIPVDTSVPAGAELYSYKVFNEVGEAKLVDDYATDFPNVELFGTESFGKIVSLGDSYQYSIQDMRRAQLLNMPLQTKKALAARHVIERKLDYIAAVGALNGTVPGFATNTNVPALSSASTPALTAGTWASRANTTAGSQTIINDLLVAQQDIFTKSQGLAQGRDLVLPLAAYAELVRRTISPDNGFDQRTLLDFLLQTGRFDSIEPWVALGTAGPSAAPRGVIYDRSPENLQLVISQDFEQLAPQAVGMTFKVLCHLRTGGVEIFYPMTMRYLDGIA